jgi:two-component system response regulator QseB
LSHAAPINHAERQPEERALHIILVEDDAQLGAAIQRALERLSYTVTWLHDGRAALAALRDETADLMLLDLGLPGKDGLDVLVEARRNNIKTPVLVMTARDTLEARVAGLDAGADEYLVKPFHLGACRVWPPIVSMRACSASTWAPRK